VSGLPEGVYVESAAYNGSEALNAGVTVAGASTGQLAVTVTGPGATVAGTVRDARGAPSADSTVVLVPEPARRTTGSGFRIAMSDQHGSYVLRGVAPGQYWMYAWQDVAQGAWQDPAFLRPYETRAARVSVDGAELESVDLRLVDVPQ